MKAGFAEKASGGYIQKKPYGSLYSFLSSGILTGLGHVFKVVFEIRYFIAIWKQLYSSKEL